MPLLPSTARSLVKDVLCRLGLLDQARGVALKGRLARSVLQKADPLPLHRDESAEPFFIVGCGRSGTTLLRRLLMAGGEAHIPPENWHLGPVLNRFPRYAHFLEWEELVHLLVCRFAFQGEGSQQIPKYWFETTEDIYPLIKELTDLPRHERSLARLLDALYRHHGETQGALPKRWGDKTPYNRKFMPRIRATFPRARFVHLLRDGTDVVSSWLKMPGYDLQERAEAWKSAVETWQRFSARYPKQCLEIRYEELTRRPAETLESVCRFLSLGFSPAMVGPSVSQTRMSQVSRLPQHTNVFDPVSTSSIGKGHRRLNGAQKAALADLIGPMLASQGYAPPS